MGCAIEIWGKCADGGISGSLPSSSDSLHLSKDPGDASPYVDMTILGVDGCDCCCVGGVLGLSSISGAPS